MIRKENYKYPIVPGTMRMHIEDADARLCVDADFMVESYICPACDNTHVIFHSRDGDQLSLSLTPEQAEKNRPDVYNARGKQEVIPLIKNTWSSEHGCWIGAAGRVAANATRRWLISHYAIPEKAITLESTGGVGQREYRLHFPALREYWWPETVDHWDHEAEVVTHKFKEGT
jgi:hypothetical protein